MKTRRRNFRKQEASSNFWPSFTDVMATVTLVLFFLMLLTYIQYIVAGKNLEAAGRDLEAAGIEIRNKESELEERGKELEFLEKQLADSQEALDASRLEISQASDELKLLQNEIEKTRAEVDEGLIALTLSRLEIEKQQQIIANSNQELAELREKLSTIAVLRLDILTKVKDSIEARLGKTNENGQPLVSIGENANLVINESLLFAFGSAQVSWEGQRLLDQLALAFEDILNDASIRDFIDTVHIEGHADSIGTELRNFEISSERAYNVIMYMFNSNPRLNNNYARYFSASAFSYNRPVNDNNTEEARKKNRRIEISISIRDSSIQKLIDEYLKGFVNATNGG